LKINALRVWPQFFITEKNRPAQAVNLDLKLENGKQRPVLNFAVGVILL